MKAVLCALALISLCLAGCATSPDSIVPAQSAGTDAPSRNALDERIAYYAHAYEVPESLIRRSILRESGYNPAAHTGAFWGLMQIRLDTARGMGYRGSARGLLDANTNLKYAVAYLSNAYVVAGGNSERALALYAGGYFYEARRKGLLGRLRTAQGV
jgi:soluble lytic murein transglycosylase-like protein